MKISNSTYSTNIFPDETYPLYSTQEYIILGLSGKRIKSTYSNLLHPGIMFKSVHFFGIQEYTISHYYNQVIMRGRIEHVI